MEYIKKIAMAFLVGGSLALLGQLFFTILAAVFGSSSPIVGPGTLILMGFFTLITFPLGVYQKIEKIGGFGAILPFSGLAAAAAGTFCRVNEEKGSAVSGVLASAKLVWYVIGAGSITAIIVALVITFVL